MPIAVHSPGHVAASGQSVPRGIDPTSGLNVHEIRFDGVRQTGARFTLNADGERSHPFDIAHDIYANVLAKGKAAGRYRCVTD